MKTLHAKFSKWITYAKQQGNIYNIFIPQQFIAYFEATALGYSTAFVSRE